MTDPRFSFVGSISPAGEAELQDRLGGTRIHIEVAPSAIRTLPGQILLYQLATLAARLFDRVELHGDDTNVAHRHFPLFNGAFLPALRTLLPMLRKSTVAPDNGRVVQVLVGNGGADSARADIYVGAVDWVALVSTSSPQPVREGTNPCGALAAGALAAGEVFKIVFDGRLPAALRASDINLSVLTYKPVVGESLFQQPALPEQVVGDAALVGCGSVGCAFLQGIIFTPSLTG